MHSELWLCSKVMLLVQLAVLQIPLFWHPVQLLAHDPPPGQDELNTIAGKSFPQCARTLLLLQPTCANATNTNGSQWLTEGLDAVRAHLYRSKA